MGDMADWTLEQMESDELYFANVMYDEETDSYKGHGHRKSLYCKVCNKGPLDWRKIGSRWIMYEKDGSPHDCPKNPLSLQVLKEIANIK